MIDEIQRAKDQAHFEKWVASGGGEQPSLEYVWHAAVAYGRRTLREASASMRRCFPHGTILDVDAPTFHGIGIVDWRDYVGPADNLPVRLENGNVWWYHVAHCEPRRSVKNLPPSIRRTRLRMAGIKCAA